MTGVKGKRVAVLVEKFYEDLELWYPVLRLREAGCDVKIVGPKAGETYASKHGYPARADVAAGDVKAADFDAIIIPGGYSPDHMRRHAAMVDLVTQAGRMGKVLAAICHGPWMLCSAHCLQGSQGHRIHVDPRRRRERRWHLGRRALRPRPQPRHQPHARRPARLHAGHLRGAGRADHEDMSFTKDAALEEFHAKTPRNDAKTQRSRER